MSTAWGATISIASRILPVFNPHSLILAGGLNTGNIREAIDIVAPHAVDINSGVESSPGRKDHEKVRAIIEIVRSKGEQETEVFRL